MKKSIVLGLFIVFVFSNSCFAMNYYLQIAQRTYYFIKYASAKDSLVAIKKEKEDKYIVYPKYTFKKPFRFFYIINKDLYQKMKEENLGNPYNPFNKNLKIMPKLINNTIKIKNRNKKIKSKVLSFKNLKHLKDNLNTNQYELYPNKKFQLYIYRIEQKYIKENNIDKQYNQNIKSRFIKCLRRFWFHTILKKQQ